VAEAPPPDATSNGAAPQPQMQPVMGPPLHNQMQPVMGPLHNQMQPMMGPPNEQMQLVLQLGDIYKKLYQKLTDKTCRCVSEQSAVCSVRRTIQLSSSSSSSSSSASSLIIITDQHGVVEMFDKVIFACDAETVLKTLVKPTLCELWVLGSMPTLLPMSTSDD